MKLNFVINTLSLCSALLHQAALELNGGRPLPKLSIPLPIPNVIGTGLPRAKPKKGPALQPGARGCAIIGCSRPLRAKGYCGAHGQKRHLLEKTGRLPAAWKDYAEPGTVADLELPRGRAASKLLAQQNAKKSAT